MSHRLDPHEQIFGMPRGTGGGTLDPSEVADFLAHQWVAVSSSNHVRARWDEEARTLEIQYDDGSTWAYDPVSRDEATDYLLAPSKGTWMWDHVRVRGSKHAHQKNARQIG